ncbi:AsmA family protein [Nisaea acidiphila]|uniref:AsmA family protein n=1 Tax=Nisaea acidiphila TaxID=1862145 RepID=A0A9J7AQ18_9PROT|nr:AsmA family protein [Nisaea acidiphila]UUX48689.1 AsmA family protein [Nisaea acidiphila]
MRYLKYSLLGVLALVVLTGAGAALFVATLEPEDVKRFVEEEVTERSGRRLRIDGPLSYEISMTPKISVSEVSFQNADWSEHEEMLRIGKLQISLDLNRILSGVVQVDNIFLEHAKIRMERRADGSANWNLFSSDEDESGADRRGDPEGRIRLFPIVESVTLINVDVLLDDALDERRHHVEIDLVDLDAPTLDDPVEAVVRMKIDDRDVDIAGNLPPAVSIGDAAQPQPFDITGEALGQPFTAAGKLVFAYEGGRPVNIAIQDFKGTAFGSDLSGLFKLDLASDIPLIAANLRSEKLDTRGIEALIAGTRKEEPAETAEAAPSRQLREIVDDRIPVEWLDEASVDIALNIKSLVTGVASATDLSAQVVLGNGRLEISPFWAVYEGSPIRFEATVGRDGDAIAGAVDLTVSGADFDRLAGAFVDTKGFEAGGNLVVKYRTSGTTVGHAIERSVFELSAQMPEMRYRDPAGPVWGRDATAKRVGLEVVLAGTDVDSLLKALDKASHIRLDTPLEGTLLAAFTGTAKLHAEELSTPDDNARDILLEVALQDKVLTAKISEMLLAGARLSVDARLARVGDASQLEGKLYWQDVDLGLIGRRVLSEGSLSGEGDFDINLRGQARTVAAMLTALDGEIGINLSDVVYKRPDPAGGPEQTFTISQLAVAAPSMAQPFEGRIAGAFEGQTIEIAGSFPPPKALVDQGTPLPFAFTGRALDEPVSVKGNLTLVQVGDTFTSFSLTGLDTKIGKSDLRGDVRIGLEGERPNIKLSMASDFLDLEPLLGKHFKADRNGGEESKAETAGDPLDEPFPVEVLGLIDGDFDLRAATLQTPGALFQDLTLRTQVQNKVLTVFPSNGVFNGGRFNLEGKVDGSKPELADFAVKGDWRDAEFGNVLREYFDTTVLEGRSNMLVDLTARGRVPREAMDTVNGQFALVVQDGTMANAYWELLAADLLTGLLPALGRDTEEGRLNCLATRYEIQNGVANTVVFLVDSSRVTVGGTGTIDLRDEKIDMIVTPKPKNFSFVSLAHPIRITGDLQDPSIYPDPVAAATTAAKSVGAAALTVVNPLTLIVPFLAPGSSEDPCPTAIALAEGLSPEEAAKRGASGQKSSGEDAAESGAPKPAQNDKGSEPTGPIRGIFGGIKKLLE